MGGGWNAGCDVEGKVAIELAAELERGDDDKVDEEVDVCENAGRLDDGSLVKSILDESECEIPSSCKTLIDARLLLLLLPVLLLLLSPINPHRLIEGPTK